MPPHHSCFISEKPAPRSSSPVRTVAPPDSSTNSSAIERLDRARLEAGRGQEMSEKVVKEGNEWVGSLVKAGKETSVEPGENDVVEAGPSAGDVKTPTEDILGPWPTTHAESSSSARISSPEDHLQENRVRSKKASARRVRSTASAFGTLSSPPQTTNDHWESEEDLPDKTESSTRHFLRRSRAPSPSTPSYLVRSIGVCLTCLSCKRLFDNPTTLACGHSLCLSCAQSKENRGRSPLDEEIDPFANLTPRSVSALRSPNSSSIVPPPSPSATPLASPSSLSSIARRSRVSCPHPNCSAKNVSQTAVELKIDFVLQSVLGLLRRVAPEIGTTLESSDEWDESEEGGKPSTHPPEAPRMAHATSELSLSSAGGGEDPGDAETKRHHKPPRWRSSKKSRPRSPSLTHVEHSPLPSSFLIDLQGELECHICTLLYHDPITSPCGHTFCQKCLTRSLDHSDKCPLCRCDFPAFTYVLSQPVNSTTRDLVELAFPLLASERKALADAEQKEDMLDTPLFVCTLAWPNLPTYLHVFEPRYRLMLRRVLDGNRQFGMVLPSANGGVHEYGTMLRVQSCSMTEDGRSIIECIGTFRFRILERGTRDGYSVGRIEKVEDVSAEQEAELEHRAVTSPLTPNELSTQALVSICLEFVQLLRSGSAPWVLQRLNNTIGPVPTNPSDFSFWMAEVMPVDDHVKAALLQITSPRERLRLIVFWIEQFRSSWWFSRGCSVM